MSNTKPRRRKPEQAGRPECSRGIQSSFFILFALLLFLLPSTSMAQEGQVNLCRSPEVAVQTMLRNLHADKWDRKKASTCLEGDEKLTLQLKQVLDARGIYIDYDNIPEEENYLNEKGEARAIIDPRLPEIVFEKKEMQWVLSENSRKIIPELYSDTFSKWVQKLLDLLPALCFENFLGFQIWQYLLFLCMLLIAWIAGRLVNYIISTQLIKYFQFKEFNLNEDLLLTLRRPIVWLTVSALFLAGIPDLQLSIRPSQALHFIAHLVLSFSAVLLCSRIIDFSADIFAAKAANTDSKLDDQLIPLVKRAGKALVWLLGVIFILQNLGIQVTALVAFGSVGGLAIAMASKDTVENLFGSFVVFIDQPFQIGDFVVIDGSIEGTIEEVGFRSTKVRTLTKSIITVPNSKIAHCTVNNFSRREQRPLKVTLSLRYDTPTASIEIFMEKIKEYLHSRDDINKNAVMVYFSAMNASSLDVLVLTFVESPDWTKEMEAKQECFLQFMKIAEELNIGYAFPTTTIELEDKHFPKP